ncbi:TrkA C-terminal domain-containing protein [Brachybacterium massiliense]|uniref:aspartate-alanine antiporter-like transporter n=1 Tax=Brachybacterium massiliense TaxID=1755098 RepID=UPI001482D6CC|nr:TrkA C-terminal domain-containing protein [Brachybacterium massiliense]
MRAPTRCLAAGPERFTVIAALEGSPLLTLFLVVATGAVLGAIPFGRIRLGAAGALFTGLALSAIAPHLGEGMEIVQTLGLALFVYTVGISAGAAFFGTLNRQLSLLAAATVSTVLAAAATLALGQVLGLARDLSLGLFTGALTAAPALDAAARLTGTGGPSVGYSFGYPIGVIVGIVLVSAVVSRAWPGRRDTPARAGTSLSSTTVRVQRSVNLRDVPQWHEQLVRFSYLRREGRVRVIVPGEDLLEGDEVVAVGMPDQVRAVTEELGETSDQHIAHDRSLVEFTRLTVSNPDLASRSIAELNLPVRFGAVVTRVRRGDLELLARDDLVLEPGDRIAVVVDRRGLDAVHSFLGDSDRKAGELDVLSLGLGLVLGVALGLLSFPMPGGGMFALGPAAGPLLVGMVLGALRRTGPVVWALPGSANRTLRQLGLLLFLAGLGLTAGPEFAQMLASPTAWRAAVLSAVVALLSCLALLIAARWVLDLSAPRAAGAVAGFLGQPAVLEAANAKAADERIEAAYATLFAFSIVVKILLVPVIWNL